MASVIGGVTSPEQVWAKVEATKWQLLGKDLTEIDRITAISPPEPLCEELFILVREGDGVASIHEPPRRRMFPESGLPEMPILGNPRSPGPVPLVWDWLLLALQHPWP